MFFSEPIPIKNPYNNLPFNKSTLYNIYFYIRFNTNYYPELFFKFFDVDFNLTIFKNKNEYLLREKAISNFVYKSTSQILVNEIKRMITKYNYVNKKNKIIIDEDFPKDKLIRIFQPYLLLHVTSQYAFLEHKKTEANYFLKRSLKRFQSFNPQFGRKKYKLLMGYKRNFKRFIKEKLIEFDDRHIKFNDVEYQNEIFLEDHLKYEENSYEFVRVRAFFSFNFIANYDNNNNEDGNYNSDTDNSDNNNNGNIDDNNDDDDDETEEQNEEPEQDDEQEQSDELEEEAYEEDSIS
jgi:hypothetical protein